MFLEEFYPYALHIFVEEGRYGILAVPALLQNWFFFNVRFLHSKNVDGYDTLCFGRSFKNCYCFEISHLLSSFLEI